MQNKKNKRANIISYLNGFISDLWIRSENSDSNRPFNFGRCRNLLHSLLSWQERGGNCGRTICIFLIDLLSSAPQWMFISLLIHGAQGYFCWI